MKKENKLTLLIYDLASIVVTGIVAIAIIFTFVDRFDFFDFIIANTDKAQAAASSLQVYMTTPELVFNVVTSVLMLVSVVATIFSGYDYLKGGKDLLKN